MAIGGIKRSETRLQKGVTSSPNGLELSTSQEDFGAIFVRNFLFVEGRSQHSNHKMRKI